MAVLLFFYHCLTSLSCSHCHAYPVMLNTGTASLLGGIFPVSMGPKAWSLLLLWPLRSPYLVSQSCGQGPLSDYPIIDFRLTHLGPGSFYILIWGFSFSCYVFLPSHVSFTHAMPCFVSNTGTSFVLSHSRTCYSILFLRHQFANVTRRWLARFF